MCERRTRNGCKRVVPPILFVPPPPPPSSRALVFPFNRRRRVVIARAAGTTHPPNMTHRCRGGRPSVYDAQRRSGGHNNRCIREARTRARTHRSRTQITSSGVLSPSGWTGRDNDEEVVDERPSSLVGGQWFLYLLLLSLPGKKKGERQINTRALRYDNAPNYPTT